LLWSCTVDEGAFEVFGVGLESVDVVGEYNRFIASFFVIINEILTRLESSTSTLIM
jgi:hypothetical protein